MIVEDIAILENLDVGRALVRGGFFQRVFQVLLKNVDGARDEGGFRTDRQRNRIERTIRACRKEWISFSCRFRRWANTGLS